MIQQHFQGLHLGLPCFLLYDEDYPFQIEMKGETVHSKEVEGVHQILVLLGAQDTVIVEQNGAVVFALHGEGVAQ